MNMKAHKKDNLKLTDLNRIKKRRMQKYHARKIIRVFKQYDLTDYWINILKAFISIKDLPLTTSQKRCLKHYRFKFEVIEN